MHNNAEISPSPSNNIPMQAGIHATFAQKSRICYDAIIQRTKCAFFMDAGDAEKFQNDDRTIEAAFSISNQAINGAQTQPRNIRQSKIAGLTHRLAGNRNQEVCHASF